MADYSYEEALQALFGDDPNVAEEDHVDAYLNDEDSIDSEDIAEALDVLDAWNESIDFHDNMAEYIKAHPDDPRIDFWGQIRDAEQEEDDDGDPPADDAGDSTVTTTTTASTGDDPDESVEVEPSADPVSESGSPADDPLAGTDADLMGGMTRPPKRGVLDGLGGGSSTTRATAPEKRLVLVDADRLAATADKARETATLAREVRRKVERNARGSRRGRNEPVEHLIAKITANRPAPRSSAIPLRARQVLATERWGSFRAQVAECVVRVRANEAVARAELVRWKNWANQFRDGQTGSGMADRDFGAMLARLIEAFEQGKDITDNAWFYANFVDGFYKESSDD